MCIRDRDYREYRERYPLAEKAGPAGEGGWFLVLAATGDPEADRLAALDGRRAGAFVNVAGKKEMSDFYFPGLAKQGPVVAGVTAGGTDHRLAKRMTEACLLYTSISGSCVKNHLSVMRCALWNMRTSEVRTG